VGVTKPVAPTFYPKVLPKIAESAYDSGRPMRIRLRRPAVELDHLTVVVE
jgi:hypothetical protein